MSDYLLKIISESGTIRGYAAITTDLVNEAYRRIEPASLSGVMLGRALTAGALMGCTVKGKERISLRFEGNGPLGSITVEGNPDGEVRGTIANSSVEFVENEDLIAQLRKSIGIAGVLTVTKDLGLKEPYRGTVNLASGEIGEDLAYYLTESEQIPSAVSVGVIPSEDGKGVDIAGGYLIQTIPAEGGLSTSDEANLEAISEMAQALGAVTELLMDGGSPEAILKQLFTEVPYRQLDSVDLSYTCNCSHASLLRALSTLPKDQIAQLCDQEGETEVVCQFCKKKYYYNTADFESLL